MNIRILYLEDDVIDRMAVLRMVRTEGLPYDMVTAGSIAEAQALLEKDGYDLAILDYMLPDGTGLDLLQRMRIKEVPAVFVTGSGDASVAVQAMKGGAYDYLLKDPERTYLKLLPSTIDKALRAFQLEQEHKKDVEQMAVMNEELSRMYEEVKLLSLRDPLTGLANRRMMEIDLERSMALAKRGGSPLSVLMMDIDYFKKYNDTHGHQAGDRLLKEVGNVLTEEVRTGDLVARYGGEEFLVLLPDTEIEGAVNTAERIRTAVSESLGVTISIGAAAYQMEEKPEGLIERADKALYRAKEGGRNRVEVDL